MAAAKPLGESSAGLGSITRHSPRRSLATSDALNTCSTDGNAKSRGRSREALYSSVVAERTRRERSAYSRFASVSARFRCE